MTVKDLTPAARTAVENKTIGGGWDGRSLIKLIGELERWDNVAEARKAIAAKIFKGSAIGSVIGFFAFVVIGGMAGEFLWGLLFFLAPLAALFMGICMKKAARAIDLPNELRVSLRPVLRQLSQDLHPDEKIKVSMNLAGIDEKKCFHTKSLPPGINRTLTQSTFMEDLCSIRLPLTDGSHAVLRIENTYLKIERRYTGRRGKSKSKTKWKKLSAVTAILIPPERINWDAARMSGINDPANAKIAFVEKDGVLAARMDRCYKFKAADGPPGNAVPAVEILRMFVRLSAMRPQGAGGSQ